MPSKEEIGHPGAGTLFVYAEQEPVGTDASRWDELLSTSPVITSSPDRLLIRGIADYTFLPQSQGGVLGRGKFSTVYKVLGADGRFYALKHTALHPHHPLISARLLREPTLLAQLPPHPCLIGVDGFVRTEGHFYLIEECASTYVPLPQHPLPLSPSRAGYILDQLVSVVRDGLHESGRVCHRDLKGENILVDITTGNILLLDLGLATHFSASEPKLTTCCGSPAFHSPEIVNALNHAPGEITYYGPELDIWCIALTMLSLLLQTRFPLGPTHTSRLIMAERCRDRLQELDELYPPETPWRGLGPHISRHMKESECLAEREAWKRVRRAMRDFVDMDAERRMAYFARYDVGDHVTARVAAHAAAERGKTFKTTTFLAADVKYTLPLYLEPPTGPTEQSEGDVDAECGPLVLRNPSGESERRIMSYVKYLLRSAGILYHHVADTHPAVLQLVLPIMPPSSPGSQITPTPEPTRDWVTTLLGLGKKTALGSPRSASVPPKSATRPTTSPSATKNSGRGKKEWAQQCWMRVEIERTSPGGTDRAPSRAASRASSRTASSRANSRASSSTRKRSGDSLVLAQDGNGIGVVHEHEIERLSAPLSRPQSSRLPSQTARTSTLPTRGEIYVPPSPLSQQLSCSPQASLPAPLLTIPPSPTFSSESPASPTTSSRPAYKRALSSRRSPRVVITLTEKRAYPLVRRALDVVAPPRVRTRGSDPLHSPVRALAIPVPSSSSGSGSDVEGEGHDEPERGRPRSKESPPDHNTRSETTVRPQKPAAVPIATSKMSSSDTVIPVIPRGREMSTTRKSNRLLESLFGKGIATDQDGHVQRMDKSRRSNSVPPTLPIGEPL